MTDPRPMMPYEPRPTESSSEVEQSAVNRPVGGSTPSSRATSGSDIAIEGLRRERHVPLESLFRRMGSVLLLSLLLTGQAWGAVPEIPGNGIDDPFQTGGSANGTKGSCPGGYADAIIGNGCDKLLPGNDQDNDGYTSDGSLGRAGTTYKDCDDTRRDVFPGVYIPNSWTSPTGYQKCQNDGTFTTAVLNSTTPLCEATGTGVCKYVDCGSGSNSNAGTYAAPYLTLGKVSGGAGGTVPASPYTLAAGDVVYILGSTSCTTTFTEGVIASLTATGVFTTSGTSSNRITIKRYPGATASVAPTSGKAFVISGNYIKFEDLDLQGASGSLLGYGSNFELSRSWIHDHTALNGDNNDSGLNLVGTNDSFIHHNFFEEIKRTTGNDENVSVFLWLDNDASGQGANHLAQFNVAWLATKNDTLNGGAFRQKHGANCSDTGPNGHRLLDNYIINYQSLTQFNGACLRASRNLIYDGALGEIRDSAESNGQADNQFTYNTVYSGSLLWSPNLNAPKPGLTVTDNVIVDLRSSYVAGNSEGILSVLGYGSDSDESDFRTNNRLTSNRNCFYNPNATLNFCWFCQTSGGSAGPAGGNYSFSTWKSTLGVDANSFVENPNFDSNYVPQSTNCQSKGWSIFNSGSTPTARRKGSFSKSTRKGQG